FIAELSYQQVRGQTHRLTLELPAGWRLDEVDSSPSGFLQNWFIDATPSGHAELVIDLDQPLHAPLSVAGGEASEPGTSLKLRVVLVPEKDAASALDSMFPQVVPKGAQSVEGVFAIAIDPRFQATVETPLAAMSLMDRALSDVETIEHQVQDSGGRAPGSA